MTTTEAETKWTKEAHQESYLVGFFMNGFSNGELFSTTSEEMAPKLLLKFYEWREGLVTNLREEIYTREKNDEAKWMSEVTIEDLARYTAKQFQSLVADSMYSPIGSIRHLQLAQAADRFARLYSAAKVASQLSL